MSNKTRTVTLPRRQWFSLLAFTIFLMQVIKMLFRDYTQADLLVDVGPAVLCLGIGITWWISGYGNLPGMLRKSAWTGLSLLTGLTLTLTGIYLIM